ncbi:D-alanyl-D-alanine carboxypeptidase [Rhizobium sp. KVB221]|uniref:serine-type D-Ala-D-Ala carboxypeptidase n=1 Tax=Rhizobium setariae TaxID=2801340 RepID=A0A937CP86_9HYPH|nr:D-alanyl-D-alanine carboxypeptidase family protein [Rhizobium setariae]MBL0372909.1 D-alanyl-D-alanine carboxypeptidase [Rhizobium setariae]
MPTFVRHFVVVFWLLAGFAPASGALAQTALFETKAKQLFLIEDSTGTVLLAKDEDALIPPASLAKLFTAEYVFNELQQGRLRPDAQFKVSEYAWRTGGALSRTSTMFAALNSSIMVSDLLQGVIVHSANDACIILGEGLAGTEAAFTELLNKRIAELDLQKSVLGNSNGLPNPANKTSMRDLVTIARHIHTQYPDYFKLYSQADFEWNKIRQRNKNPFVAMNIGVDGMAVGFAEGSGYAVVATVQRDGTRLFLAMSGLSSDKERSEETRRVLNWGLTSFVRHTVFSKGEVVAEAPVFGGDSSHVPLQADANVDIYVPVDNPDRIRARITYTWPLKAPIAPGQRIGTMTISVGERPVSDVAVHAVRAVGTGTLTSKAFDGLKELLFFWL